MRDRARALEDGRRALGLIVIALAAWAAARSPGEQPAVDTPDLRADPNTAPEGVLLALPNLGPARVRALRRASRSEPFRSIDDIDRRVKGIGPVISEGLRPYLRFDAPRPAPPSR
jgi:DNA uptake protein ComE-like DNA-binding protein